MISVEWDYTPSQLEVFRQWFESEERPMKLDIEALAREAGAPYESHLSDPWIMKSLLPAYTNAVLEAAARECDIVVALGLHPEANKMHTGAMEAAQAIRAMKVTP